MAGVDVGGGGGGRRKDLDSEINMIPMIDLLMVTISFLLITAVWTHMGRLDTSAQVPGLRTDVPPQPVESKKELHVIMHGEEKFVLVWKQGKTTIDTIDVPRREVVRHEGDVDVVRFPDLALKVENEWKAKGQHSNPSDREVDQAVLHTDDKAEFKDVIGVIDAVYRTHRDMRVGPKLENVPAFNATFAVD